MAIMSVEIVIQQMIIIFILIFVGVFLYKTKKIDENVSTSLSWIVVNITNPLTLITAALTSSIELTLKHLFFAIGCFIVAYAILFLMSHIIPAILRVPPDDRFSYRMLTLFSNVGFIGIPFVSAVLGNDALIYVSICCLVFNLIIYTYGINVMSETGRKCNPESNVSTACFSVKKLFNFGTVSSLLTILIYALHLRLPEMVSTTTDLMGRCTTFLSMLVLGTSLARIKPVILFTKWRLYIFTILRFVLIPIGIAVLAKFFITDKMLLQVLIIEMSLPCANMPLMLAKEYKTSEETISCGIILTTLLSIITLPIVVLFL